MRKRQVNLKLEASLVKEVEELVEKGYFRSKTEAFTKALQLLIRTYKAKEIREKIEDIRRETENLPSTTKAVAELHEEED